VPEMVSAVRGSVKKSEGLITRMGGATPDAGGLLCGGDGSNADNAHGVRLCLE
jgi:hypothetical protein